jgi:ATP-dependent DNA helicase PIF1
VARELRGLQRPGRAPEPSAVAFGGLQLVLCGDFAQLPPVQKGSSSSSGSGKARFLFQATSWAAAVQQLVLLRQPFRQSGDQALHKTVTRN